MLEIMEHMYKENVPQALKSIRKGLVTIQDLEATESAAHAAQTSFRLEGTMHVPEDIIKTKDGATVTVGNQQG